MEIPGTAPLTEAKLRLTTEAGRHVYLLEEPASGRLFRMSKALAGSYLNVRAALARRIPTTPEIRAEASALAAHLTKLRGGAIGAKKPFNPLFTMIPLFDARPLQPAVTGAARVLFSTFGAFLFIALALVAFWLGAASDFYFIDRVGDVFSLEAIVTFALFAPFLKVFHEGGHLLAATRFGVPVRNAGVMLIALFPLPFVDCTEAEFRAQRLGRIVISLAGLLADVAVGLIAFIAWHFVEAGATRDILSNIVILSTVTTLVFNLNPLMRLDGYFALSDALHRRNLHMESALSFTSARRAIAGFDFGRFWSVVSTSPGLLTFGMLAFAYKIYILLFIAWTIAPQYLGIGAGVLIWGAAVMFLTPLMKAPAPDGGGAKARRGRVWWLLGPALIAGIAFIPMTYTVTAPVYLDADGAYSVRAEVEGDVIEARRAGAVEAGEELISARDIETEVQIALNDADAAMLGYLADSVQAEDPLAAEGARERIAATRALGADLEARQSRLTITASDAGWFTPDSGVLTGARMKVGDRIGVLLPEADEAVLTGDAPALYAEKFRNDLIGLELRGASGAVLGDDALTARMDQFGAGADGVETFRVRLEAGESPLSLGREPQVLKMTFAAEPLWRHAIFLAARLRLAFLRAQAQNADIAR